jgi:hypothetical protein
MMITDEMQLERTADSADDAGIGVTNPRGSAPRNDGLFQELNQGVIGITVLLA